MSVLVAESSVLENSKVEVNKFYENGKNYLHFVFRDKFTLDSSQYATTEWKRSCDKEPTTRFVHIWDCASMHGYDKSAKDLWMEYMDKYSQQISKIVVISDNIILRGAARIMSKFTKHELSVYKTYDDMIEGEL